MIRKYVILTAALWGLMVTPAQAESTVADVMRFEIERAHKSIGAGLIKISPIQLYQGLQLEVAVNLRNRPTTNVSAYVCNKNELSLFRSNRKHGCAGVDQAQVPFTFNIILDKTKEYFLVLDNRYDLTSDKQVDYSITLNFELEGQFKQLKEKIEMGMEEASKRVSRAFIGPPISYKLRPCRGQYVDAINDNESIIVCSEDFFYILENELDGALEGLLFHNLGHSLLKSWSNPNWESEELVDEFAIVMLLLDDSQETIHPLLSYLETQVSFQQARLNPWEDNAHEATAERILNIRSTLANPEFVIERWRTILYPKMTKGGLQRVLDAAPEYADETLLKKYMATF